MGLFDKISNTLKPTLSNNIFTQVANLMDKGPSLPDNQLGGVIKKFFEPEEDGRLRFRDVVREIPGEAVSHYKGLSNFGREVLQGTARETAGAGLTVANAINKTFGTGRTQKTLKAPEQLNTFEDAFYSVLFGNEDIESLGTRIEKFPHRASGFGDAVGVDISEDFAKPFALPFVIGMTALEFTGAGGAKDDIAKFVAKSTDASEIAFKLRTAIKNFPDDVVDDVAEQLVKVTNPAKVDSIIRQTLTMAKNTRKFGEARMVTSADDLFTTMDDFVGNIPSKKILKQQGDEIVTQIDELIGQLENPNLNRQIDLDAIDELVEIQQKLVKGTDKAADHMRFFEIAKLKANEPNIVKALAEKQRAFAETIKGSKNTAPEVARRIASNYNPLNNRQTLGEAKQFIRQDINEALRIAKDPLSQGTARNNAISQLLIQNAQNAGRFDEAIEIVEATAERATRQGQGIQALSMWNRLSPEGVLRYTQKVINKANQTLPDKKKLKITDEFAKDIVQRAKKIEKMVDGEDKAFETAIMLSKIQDVVPSTIGQKLSTYQILVQLLNPKTLIRNIGGNTAFSALENVTDAFAVAIDSPLSLLTGKRTKVLPSVTTQIKGFKRGLKLGVRDALHGVDTAGLPTRFDIPKTPVFKGPVGRNAEKLLNIVLRGPDRAAYKAAYDNSIYTQLKAASKGRKGKAVLEATEEMKEIAHLDGLYRTFQDDNVISNMFVGLKRVLNAGQDFGMGDIVLKYPKTPGNLIARGLEYSPAGFVNTMFQAARPLMGHTFNQKKFVEAFSRAIVGSGSLVGMGALMHRLGIITGRREEDKDINNIQRVTGLGEYRINASALKRFVLSGFDPESAQLQEGDALYTYDWFQPLAIGISMGANIDDTHQRNETTGDRALGVAGAFIEAVGDGVNSLGEQPLISNFTRLFKYGDFSDAAIEAVKQIPRSFLPTLLSQVNQFVDNKSRNVYDPNVVREAYNLAKQRVPAVSGGLPPRIDSFGQDMEVYHSGGNNLFNVFFNPSFRSVYTPTPEAQLVLDLYEETGEVKQAPRIVSKTATINGEKIKLGPKQITALQMFVGTVSRDYFHQLANSPDFQALSPEDKIKHMSNVLTDIGRAGKIVILGDRPTKTPPVRTLSIIQNYLRGNTVLQERIGETLEQID